MTTPQQLGRAVPVRRGRRAVRIAVLCLVVAALLFLAVIGWIPGR
jgi:TRAP-type C4-dicarboxylate transport system permease small subunit